MRSIGGVYCIWQLMFADIFNNKTKSYIDISIYTLWETPDCTHDVIGHLILFLSALINVHLLLHIISVLFQYILSPHARTLFALHLFFYFTYSFGHFLTTLDLHVQIECFFLSFRYSMRLYMLRGAEVSLFLIINISTLLFIWFPDSLYIVPS